jgi:hypothetical protein
MAAFARLCEQGAGLVVPAGAVPGLPDRPLRPDELRDVLLDPRTSGVVRDTAWAFLVTRARGTGGDWVTVAVGVAMPALGAVAARLCRRFAGDPADIHAEVLRGFIQALTEVDLGGPAIVLRLRWAAYRAGLAAVRQALDAPVPLSGDSFESSQPALPWGHPDLVLADAVAEGAITIWEARLIGQTRLDEVPLALAAAQRDMTYWATARRRLRAEQRLIAYVRGRIADAPAGGAPPCPVVGGPATSTATTRRPRRTAGRPARPNDTRPSTRPRRGGHLPAARMSKTRPGSGVGGCEEPTHRADPEAQQ